MNGFDENGFATDRIDKMVYEKSSQIKVLLYQDDPNAYDAEIVYANEETDLAYLQIPKCINSLYSLKPEIIDIDGKYTNGGGRDYFISKEEVEVKDNCYIICGTNIFAKRKSADMQGESIDIPIFKHGINYSAIL